MKTEIISCEALDAIDRAVAVFQAGGLVAFPTDTVYGVAAPAFSKEGIDRLYEAKGRENNKAISVLIGNHDQLNIITPNLTQSASLLAQRFWPGGLTLIVSRRPELPNNLSPLPTIGVRMPNHPFAIALIIRCGPLATTSANLSGGPDPQTVQDVLAQLDGRIALVFDGGATPGGIPSSVVDCTLPEPAILRSGAISTEDILNVLQRRSSH
jgi:L-threonylcarbamoyladenylate synthase